MPTDSAAAPPRRRRKATLPASIIAEPFADYAARDALNWTKLKEARRSALRFEYRLTHRTADSPRFGLGRAGHTAIMEPDRFLLEYAVWEGGVRRGAEWEAFKNAHAGRTILTAEEYALALGMRDGIRRHPIARNIFRGGESERSVLWTDEATGIECKARIDHWDGRRLVDLKTCRDIDARLFAGSAARLSYIEQLAFYGMGLAANGVSLDDGPPLIVAVEDSPPHDVAVFEVQPADTSHARAEIADLLAYVAEARRTKAWPGRYPEIVPLVLPAWVYSSSDSDPGDLGLAIGGVAP